MRILGGSAPETCTLRLHYHMWGINIRTLKVYTRTQNGGPLTEVDSIIGDKGSFWERMEVSFAANAGQLFQVKEILE